MSQGAFLPIAFGSDVELGTQDGDFVIQIRQQERARITSHGEGRGLFAGGGFNVKAFGAVGDGVTDDTAAIQAAVTAAAAVGGEVFLGIGTFLPLQPTLYYAGVMVAATTVPTITGATGQTAVTGATPFLSGTADTGLTGTAPSPCAALSAQGAIAYVDWS